MTVVKLSNVSLAEFRRYLENQGCKLLRTSGGHEIWVKAGVSRPMTIQSHIDPVPERIVKQALMSLGIDRKDFDPQSKRK